jgi:hypothetical protein
LYNSTETYTDVTWFSPVWGGGQITPDYAEAGADGECMLLKGLGYVALQIDKPFNLRDDVQYIHVDIYANENTDFRIGFQSWAGGEHYFPAIKYTTPGKWYSIDFPIDLVLPFFGKDVNVLRIGGGDEDGSLVYADEIYIDNIYAFGGTPKNLYHPTGTPTTAAPVPEYDGTTDIVRSLYNSTETYADVTWFSPAWGGDQVTPDYAEAGEDGECMLLKGLGYVALQIDKPFNLRDDVQYVHVDIYANENTDFRLGFQSWTGGEHYFPAIKYTTPGEWYSIDFPIALVLPFFGKDVNVLRIGGDEDETFVYADEIYVDNIYAFGGTPKNPYNPTGIKAVKEGSFNIYPSAVRETLNFQSDLAIKNIAIYSVAGQKVRSFQNVTVSVNVSNLGTGIYIVSAQLANGKTISKKIVKL